MARRQSQPAPAVSLFPFLAVLVCAMGSLILLLLVITRHVRPQTQAAAVASDAKTPLELTQQAAPVATVTEPESKPEPVLVKPEWIAQFPGIFEAYRKPQIVPEPEPEPPQATPVYPDARPFDPSQDGDTAAYFEQLRQRERLAQLKQEVAQLTAAERSMRTQVEETQQEVATQQKQLQTRTVSQSRRSTDLRTRHAALQEQIQELDRLHTELIDKSRDLKTLEKQAADRQDKLEIVTYDGPSGAKKQPVFIECQEGRIKFHPEGVTIETAELEQMPPEISPLAFAVRALAEYRAKQAGQSARPYVLMIGRPEGIKEFYGCGQLLGVNRIEFGYELIEQDRELYFGEPDPAARQVIEDAIERARRMALSRPVSRGGLSNQRQSGGGIPQRFRGAGNAAGQPSADKRNANGGRNGEIELPEPIVRSLVPKPLQSSQPGRFPAGETDSDELARREAISRAKPIDGSESAAQRGASTEQDAANKTQPGTMNSVRNPSVADGPKLPADANAPNLLPGVPPGSASEFEDVAEMLRRLPTSGTASASQAASAARSSQASSANSSPTAGSPGQFGSGSAGSRGQGRGRGDITVERKLKIRLDEVGFQVERQEVVQWSAADSTTQLERLLITQLGQEIRSWSDPPAGIRWQPALELQVAPGGNARAFHVEQLAEQWGMYATTKLIWGNARQSKETYFPQTR